MCMCVTYNVVLRVRFTDLANVEARTMDTSES